MQIINKQCGVGPAVYLMQIPTDMGLGRLYCTETIGRWGRVGIKALIRVSVLIRVGGYKTKLPACTVSDEGTNSCVQLHNFVSFHKR